MQKGKNKKMLTINLILFLIFYFLRGYASPGLDVMVRIADALFMAGLGDIIAGLACILHNGGLFKTFSYIGYRRYKKNMKRRIETGIAKEGGHLMDFAEYTVEKYKDKWDTFPYMVNGLSLMALSAVMFYL